MGKILLFFLAIILLAFSVSGQSKQDSSLVLKTVNHGLNDAKAMALSPLHWDKKDWLVLGGVSAISAASILWMDEPMNNFTRNHHTKGLNQFFTIVEPMGHTYPLIAAAGFALHGALKKDNYSLQTAIIATESYALNTIVVQLVKTTAGRTRPNSSGTTNPQQWDGPFFHGTSFYSGHTSTAFSVASVIAYRYRDTKWVPYVSYGLATIGGFQRVYQNRHWTSDVIFGALVGTAEGIFLCKQWEKNSIQFYPAILPNGGGLSVVIPIE